MKHFEKNITIKTEGASENTARLLAYIPDTHEAQGIYRIRPAVLILPGGGYEYTSEREGEPIALKFLTEGVCAFVLHYSPAPARFPQALCEALTAIGYIREHAEEWKIDKDQIAVCGFSAGGHLCASVGAFWNKSFLETYIGTDREKVKPNKLILSYPVITSGEFTHQGSMDNLLGNNKEAELLERASLENQVTKDVPPSFIWHTYEDETVPVQNALLFASALVKEQVPVELHVYRRGGHGLSLGNHLVQGEMQYGETHISSDWIDKAIRFIFD